MKIHLNTMEEYEKYARSMFTRIRIAMEAGCSVDEVEVLMSPEVQLEVLRRQEKSMEEDRKMRAESLRSNWGAPARHAERIVAFSKGWSDAQRSLLNILGTGLFVGLVGGRGTGKTQLAVELMRETTERQKSALFCSAMQFFIEVKATYGEGSKTREGAVIQKYQFTSLLVIDEMGKRGNSDWENNLLFELINRRYNDRMDTILIDNRTKAEFIETIGPSLASRMNECGGIVECNWESFRK